MIAAHSDALVFFGATGDLAYKKQKFPREGISAASANAIVNSETCLPEI